jgi:Asp-tRNA(Asn)/Glu-tRNA(Gln) amidotransferase A subunit family amidase
MITKIMNATVTELKNALLDGELTSVQLVNVLAYRCYTIGRKYEITAAEMFTEGLKVAQEKDKEREEARKNGTLEDLPLLHGIPISVKDVMMIKGVISTAGCASLANWRPKEDALLVKHLREQGAIIIVRGNVPQNVMMMHSASFWGNSKNPYDVERSCSGSSGGDAALVAARCVPLAVGTDIGGSLRSPANFCGVTTLKPTQQRLTRMGGFVMGKRKGFNASMPLTGVAGALTRSVDDLVLFH